MTSTEDQIQQRANPEKTAAIVCVVVAVVAAGLVFLPSLAQIDDMRGGYALSFVAFFMAVSGAVVAVFFVGRARALARLLAGTELLAHWTYPPDEWQRYVETERRERAAAMRGLLVVIAGWSLLFGALFWALDADQGWIVFLVMLGVTLGAAGLAFGLPGLWFRRQRRGPREALISSWGVYFGGELSYWNHWGTRLRGVEILKGRRGAPDVLCFNLSVPSRMGQQNHQVRIPIPQGHETEASLLPGHFGPTPRAGAS